MHEMSIAESILDLLQDSAKLQKFNKVKKIFLDIGVFSTIEPQALLFCFDVVAKNSLADGAQLIINHISAEGWCMKCSKNITLINREISCPFCQSYQIQINSGDEMKVKELEVE